MLIRPTDVSELPVLAQIFESARQYMRSTGNPTQWGSSRPSLDKVKNDIHLGHSYVCINNNGEIVATFAFIKGEDPTYKDIDGKWLSDAPYGTIHRMASNGIQHGIAQEIFSWCKNQQIDIRIDTHAQNATMLHVIQKAGFIHCGTIIVDDGTPREAFQWQSPQI
ncbi:MAG: GNAT family N-acetyltransferase [Bacteroidales bacterium]|nr:GNAT family N-acetyltransferase [Bacteroidales bacterium]